MTQPSSAIPGFRTRLLLGTGQTSIVYLAEDAAGREIALKVPRPEIRNDPVLGKVFYNEVVMLKTLDHPNVVRYFAGVPTGVHAYLAVQYFPEGELNPTKFDMQGLMAILLDIAGALEYCHSKKVIHQDVKPSNIYTANGRGYLADFGAASSDQNPTPPAGSPFYMSPEVFRGERGTPKSDVYSFSVMAYELFAGRRPILGDSVEELQVAHMTKVPVILKNMNPDVSRTLAKLIDRGLAKELSFRPTMRDFRVLLSDILSGNSKEETDTSSHMDLRDTAPISKPSSSEPNAPALALGRDPVAAAKLIENKAAAKADAAKIPEKKSFIGKLFGRK